MGDKPVSTWDRVLGFVNPRYLKALLDDRRRSHLITLSAEGKLKLKDARDLEKTIGDADRSAAPTPTPTGNHRVVKVGALTLTGLGVLTGVVSAMTGIDVVPGKERRSPKAAPGVTSTLSATAPSGMRTMGPTLTPAVPAAPTATAAATTAPPSPPKTPTCALPLPKVCVQLDADGHRTLNDAVRELAEGPTNRVLLCGRDGNGVELRIDIRPIDLPGMTDGAATNITWFGRGVLPQTVVVTALYRCPGVIR